LAGVVYITFGVDITFSQWFLLSFPIALTLLLVCWKYLTNYAFKFKQKAFPGGKKGIDRQLMALGKMTFEEKVVLVIFSCTALAWISRSFLLQNMIPGIDDTIISICTVMLLFVAPAKVKGERILVWKDAVKLPWDIVLLFGGGLALASGFESSGLAFWIGGKLEALDTLPFILVLVILIGMVNFLTEITSNIATTAMMLPVLVSVAPILGVHPYYLMIGATVAASCAFMMPVATPPNAIVFGSGYLNMADMVLKGFWMNVLSIIIVTLFIYFTLPLIWDLGPIQ